MAETVYTKDGKVHTLVGNTNLGTVIRDYAGEDVACRVLDALDEFVAFADNPRLRKPDLVNHIKIIKREKFLFK